MRGGGDEDPRPREQGGVPAGWEKGAIRSEVSGAEQTSRTCARWVQLLLSPRLRLPQPCSRTHVGQPVTANLNGTLIRGCTWEIHHGVKGPELLQARCNEMYALWE